MKIIQDWSKEFVKDINKEAGMNRGIDGSKDGVAAKWRKEEFEREYGEHGAKYKNTHEIQEERYRKAKEQACKKDIYEKWKSKERKMTQVEKCKGGNPKDRH